MISYCRSHITLSAEGGGVPNDYASVILTQAICKTDYGGGGGGGKKVPKIDYVICERPLTIVVHAIILLLIQSWALEVCMTILLVARYLLATILSML